MTSDATVRPPLGAANAARAANAGARDAALAAEALRRAEGRRFGSLVLAVARERAADPLISWAEIGRRCGTTKNGARSAFRRLTGKTGLADAT